MEFNYLGLCNRVLLMAQQSPITDISTDSSAWAYKAQLAVNDAVKDLVVLLKLKSLQTTFSFETVAAQRLYPLPRNLMYPPISMKQDDSPHPITPMSESDYDILIPSDTSSDNPTQYYFEEYAPVVLQPASLDYIAIKSANALDNTKVVITGWQTSSAADSSFVLQKEEITLTGTTAVTSSYQYTHLASISKDTTYGLITVMDDATKAIEYIVLGKDEKCVKVPIIGLYPIPSKAVTVTGRAYINIPSMQYELESPSGLPDYTVNAIVANAFARLMQYDPKVDTMAKESLWALAGKEMAKLRAMNANDGVLHKMKNPQWSLPSRVYFRPLDRWSA